MLLLHNQIKGYAWGQTDGIAALVGSDPSGRPEAELWVGSHPAAPSSVVGDPDGRNLDEVIASDPHRWLGPELASAGFTALPFLLKILAIGEPLSLQAHPSAAQAEAGFDREEAAGIPLGSSERTYGDRSAKPESLVSLADTWAMCGFRSTHEAAALVAKLGVAGLAPLERLLTGSPTPGSGETAESPAGMAAAFSWLLHVDSSARSALAGEIREAASRLAAESSDDPFRWVTDLGGVHPEDPTILAPLLLNVVHLAPGASVHLPAGNLHAYLRGAGVEIMAASDNVLRGGLTPKHVDVDELLAILSFEPGLPEAPERREVAPHVVVFESGQRSYGLALVEPGEGPVEIDPTGPSLLLAVGGQVDVAGPDGGCALEGGAAAFVAPGEGPLTISGPGQLWWATVGGHLPG